ncbi:PLDc N-terminal domain-containing protein [Pseudonocardia xishanensis]|uniref:PLDc N-terminal domain-containing protein n=1 Tax=Pseudonocardia xishanensis TaxID=630995 RepID=UPI0031F149D6
MKRTVTWSSLSTAQRAMLVAAGCVQFGLLGVALADIARRDPAEINGTKRRWVLVSLVNFVGPVLYLIRGRRRRA